MSENTPPSTPTFEETLKELESIVHEMEQGDLPLHQALEKFERGVQLSRTSQAALAQAEQKVKILLSENGQPSLQDFAEDQKD